MTIQFSYNKNQVLQALRYHFISRPEIKFMLILVNVFALTSAFLFYFKKITPPAVLVGSMLWFFLMISFWFILPGLVYRRAATFRDSFTMHFQEDGFSLGNERGSRSWPWKALRTFMESPHFFHLYFDSRSFFLVPKSGFKNGDEIFEMRKMLKEKVKKASN
jgi:signal transduction histidine kinase